MLSDEWNPYHYEKELGSANQSKEKDVETFVTASKEGTLIKSTVEKATEITKNDSKTIQDEKDIQIEALNVATEKESKEVVVYVKKKYDVSKSMGEAPLMHSSIFPLPVEENDPNSLISYFN